MRLIDVDTAKRLYTATLFDTEDDFNRVNDIFDYAPTIDAVVVTRCKDCQYLAGALPNDKGFLICPACGMDILPDDFCSYGERKNADENESR